GKTALLLRSRNCRAAVASSGPVASELEDPADPPRFELLGAPRPRPVDVTRERDRRVSELRLDPRELRTALERDPRDRVAERVERSPSCALADTRDLRSLHGRIEHVEYLGAFDVSADVAPKDESVSTRARIPVFEESLGLRDQVNRPGLPALRRLLADARRIRTRNDDLALEKVDVVPTEGRELAEAHACGHSDTAQIGVQRRLLQLGPETCEFVVREIARPLLQRSRLRARRQQPRRILR